MLQTVNRDEIYAELDRLLEEPRLRRLYRAAEKLFKRQDPLAHNWEHVRRDILNAVWIGAEEGSDPGLVLPAMILHDLGYVTHAHDPKQHTVHGARECHRFLQEWTPAQRELIAACILKHKGKYPGFQQPEPETIEEKVVCDADQLDKFGWVGFLQVIKVYVEYASAMGIERYKTLSGLAEALTHHRGISLYTQTARRLAAELSEPDFQEVSRKLTEELSFYEGWKERF